MGGHVEAVDGTERGEGGGVGSQKLVYHKWPDQIFPTANLAFSDDGPFGLGGRGGRDLLERGGEGGRGSRGEPPPPCRNIPNPRGTEKLLENEQLSTWECHVVGRKQRKFIIECQFRVPTSHQYKTTTTKQDIHHLMPNDSDLSCQSELDSPELEPPSAVELELEPDDDDEPESLPEWET